MSDIITKRFGGWTHMPEKLLHDGQVSDRAKMLYLYIGLHTNRDGWIAWPGNKRLADKMGIGIRAIQYLKAELEKYGYIGHNPRFRTDGGQTSNLVAQLPLTIDTDYTPPMQGGFMPPCSGALPLPQDGNASSVPVGPSTEVLAAPEKAEQEPLNKNDAPQGARTHSLEIVEDPLADPPKKAAATRKRHYATGHEIAKLYDELWLPAGAPRRSSNAPGVLVDAAKHFLGLRYTAYEGQTVQEVMAWGAARFKDAYKPPTWGQLWGGSKRPAGAALAEFLDGQWDRHGGKDTEGEAEAEFEAIFGREGDHAQLHGEG